MTEEDQLKALTKIEKRELSAYECGWCMHKLDQVGCDAIYDRCMIIERVIRRRKVLQEIRLSGLNDK